MEKNTRSPRMPARAECVAALSVPPLLESKLYIGMPSVSLNHNTNFTESCSDGGVRSHGNSTSRSGAAHMIRAGTVRKNRKRNGELFLNVTMKSCFLSLSSAFFSSAAILSIVSIVVIKNLLQLSSSFLVGEKTQSIIKNAFIPFDSERTNGWKHEWGGDGVERVGMLAAFQCFSWKDDSNKKSCMQIHNQLISRFHELFNGWQLNYLSFRFQNYYESAQ